MKEKLILEISNAMAELLNVEQMAQLKVVFQPVCPKSADFRDAVQS